jgi:hypothetical protein
MLGLRLLRSYSLLPNGRRISCGRYICSRPHQLTFLIASRSAAPTGRLALLAACRLHARVRPHRGTV